MLRVELSSWALHCLLKAGRQCSYSMLLHNCDSMNEINKPWMEMVKALCLWLIRNLKTQTKVKKLALLVA